jgi:regulator of ribonuclease activity A
VRDVEILATLPLGIKALGSLPLKTDKRGEGQQDIPSRSAASTVHPGDYVYADANGVLVSHVLALNNRALSE